MGISKNGAYICSECPKFVGLTPPPLLPTQAKSIRVLKNNSFSQNKMKRPPKKSSKSPKAPIVNADCGEILHIHELVRRRTDSIYLTSFFSWRRMTYFQSKAHMTMNFQLPTVEWVLITMSQGMVCLLYEWPRTLLKQGWDDGTVFLLENISHNI